jgi:hypothetical protein
VIRNEKWFKAAPRRQRRKWKPLKAYTFRFSTALLCYSQGTTAKSVHSNQTSRKTKQKVRSIVAPTERQSKSKVTIILRRPTAIKNEANMRFKEATETSIHLRKLLLTKKTSFVYACLRKLLLTKKTSFQQDKV